MRKITFCCHDYSMFEGELSSQEYEFIMKHTGALKRMMRDEPKEQKLRFLETFCEFFANHGDLRSIVITTGEDNRRKFSEMFRLLAMETFVEGRFNTSRQFVVDSLVVSRHKHMIAHMDSRSYAKDPFFHKDTREVFRRMFGEPSDPGTCVKVICLLPLFITFSGSMCRYLKKWLEANESPPNIESTTIKQKGNNVQEKQMKSDNEVKKGCEATSTTAKIKTEAQTSATLKNGQDTVASKTKQSDKEVQDKGLQVAQKSEVKTASVVSSNETGAVNTKSGKKIYIDTAGTKSKKKGAVVRVFPGSNETSSDSEDDKEVNELIKKTFPELHLCEPHPNDVFDAMMTNASKTKERKLHSCAFCKKKEDKVRTYKKCAKCKGKGTKFYCSKSCQRQDWQVHRMT